MRVFDPRAVQRATAEHSYLEMEFTLGLPIRYATGFMLGSHWFGLYGPGTDHAYGHLGFSTILAWADPEREVAAAAVTSGKPLLHPGMYYGYALVRTIGEACAKIPLRKASVRGRLPARRPHDQPTAARGGSRFDSTRTAGSAAAPDRHRRYPGDQPREHVAVARVEGGQVQTLHGTANDFSAE